jgi:hypothetical protein
MTCSCKTGYCLRNESGAYYAAPELVRLRALSTQGIEKTRFGRIEKNLADLRMVERISSAKVVTVTEVGIIVDKLGTIAQLSSLLV